MLREKKIKKYSKNTGCESKKHKPKWNMNSNNKHNLSLEQQLGKTTPEERQEKCFFVPGPRNC